MKPKFLLFCIFASLWVCTDSVVMASPSSGEQDVTEGQIVSGLELPHWGEGDFRGNFEVRIWPESVVVWLEEENLRSLIADPATPEEEKQSLKRILSLQRAWRTPR